MFDDIYITLLRLAPDESIEVERVYFQKEISLKALGQTVWLMGWYASISYLGGGNPSQPDIGGKHHWGLAQVYFSIRVRIPKMAT